MNQIEGQLESEAVVKVDFGTADEKHRGDCLRNWLHRRISAIKAGQYRPGTIGDKVFLDIEQQSSSQVIQTSCPAGYAVQNP